MATETKEYTCPADGCDYSGTEDSVAAHYSGTRKKPDHSGGYERAKQRMGSGDSNDSTGDDSGADDAPSSEQDSGSDTGGSHPTFGDGTPDSSTQESTGGGEDVELPCGCETFDPNDEDCPEPPFWVTCDTCGKSFKVTEL